MDALYLDYEDVLIGRNKDISPVYFHGQKPIDFNEKLAVKLFRYAIEELLGWSREETIKKFDRYMIRQMRLTKLNKYIRWPAEITEGDPAYILHLLYPDDVHFDRRKLVEDLFLRVMDGEMSFPREYFAGTEGFWKYCICFRYLVTHYRTFPSIDALYRFFLSEQGNQFLDIHRLKTPRDILSIDICDVIHSVTTQERGSDLYYGYYKFEKQWKKSGR